MLLIKHRLALAYHRAACSVTHKMLRYGIQSASQLRVNIHTHTDYLSQRN